VLLGLVIRSLFRKQVQKVQEVLPILSALALYLIMLALISSSAVTIRNQLDQLPKVIIVTFLQIVLALAFGYVMAAVSGLSRRERIAIVFQVGIYNSGLGAALAASNFGAFAALPALANAIFNLIIGSLVTAYLVSRVAKVAELGVPEGAATAVPAAGEGR
jgi:BASS family bile acid:Na+ symporter